MEKFIVERNIWINAPQDRVWQAITTTEQLQQWWGHDYWAITELKLGGIVKFGDADDPMIAVISVLDPPNQFTLHWSPQAQYHLIEMYTTYVLVAENGGTRVTVTETGLEALPPDLRQERYDATFKGYATVLAGLRDYIESGI